MLYLTIYYILNNIIAVTEMRRMIRFNKEGTVLVSINSGLLEACVLALLSREDSYGYKLTQDVKDLMSISESTLYPVLKRVTKRRLFGDLRYAYRWTQPQILPHNACGQAAADPVLR